MIHQPIFTRLKYHVKAWFSRSYTNFDRWHISLSLAEWSRLSQQCFQTVTAMYDRWYISLPLRDYSIMTKHWLKNLLQIFDWWYISQFLPDSSIMLKHGFQEVMAIFDRWYISLSLAEWNRMSQQCFQTGTVTYNRWYISLPLRDYSIMVKHWFKNLLQFLTGDTSANFTRLKYHVKAWFSRSYGNFWPVIHQPFISWVKQNVTAMFTNSLRCMTGDISAYLYQTIA